MITDEGRRAVAARLRELPSDTCAALKEWEEGGLFIDSSIQDEADYSQIHNAVLGCFPAEHMHPGDYEELHERLADLIDPTCEYVPIGGGRFGCSGCWYIVRLDFDIPVTDEIPMPFKHCPNCGARVVNDD